jgi:hypothetical protein
VENAQDEREGRPSVTVTVVVGILAAVSAGIGAFMLYVIIYTMRGEGEGVGFGIVFWLGPPWILCQIALLGGAVIHASRAPGGHLEFARRAVVAIATIGLAASLAALVTVVLVMFVHTLI